MNSNNNNNNNSIISQKEIHNGNHLEAYYEHQNESKNSLKGNLFDLTKINLENITDILKSKYNSGNYYCDASRNTLIALNPCETRSNLYSERVMNFYREWSLSYSSIAKPIPPHIFKYAAIAWKILTSNRKASNQTLLVSGESGSGKTESINFIMSYFAHVSNTKNSKAIEDILLSTNPILEAFGNASTALNDNSSRFGKYIQLFFDGSNLVSANIVTYLLEKTRSLKEFNCKAACTNRNFHIFYECMLGANDLEQKDWGLTKPLINKNSNQIVNSTNFLLKLNVLKKSFTDLEIFCFFNDVLKLVSAISHLNCCSLLEDLTQFENFSKENLDQAARLLGFKLKDLENYILIHELKINYGIKKESNLQLTNNIVTTTFKNVNSNKTRKSLLLLLNGKTKSQESLKKVTILKKSCNLNELKQRLNCLIKLIYTEIFKWLVKKINTSLNGSSFGDEKLGFIGLLDIYGFENLENNCLEQLCINYANEKLHQCFIESHFKLAQQDYISESIEWKPIKFDDNIWVLNLLEQNNDCIFNLINEESILKREVRLKNSNSGVLLTKINTTLNERNLKRTQRNNNFVIKHYAGCVTYNAQHLIYKNNDHMPEDLPSFLMKSSNHFLKNEILENFFRKHNNDDENKTNFNKKKSFTVLSKFKRNLDILLKLLQTSEINYIRCIKPNNQMEPKKFDENLVRKQLEACGIVSILKISEHEYAHKYFYIEFLHKYMSIIYLFKRMYSNLIDSRKLDKYLAFYLNCRKAEEMVSLVELKNLVKYFIEVCIRIKNLQPFEQFKLGTRRIFLKTDLVNALNETKESLENYSIRLIQSKWRVYRHNKAASKIQRWWLRKTEYTNRKISELRKCISISSLDTTFTNTISLYESPTNSLTRFKPEKEIFFKFSFQE